MNNSKKIIFLLIAIGILIAVFLVTGNDLSFDRKNTGLEVENNVSTTTTQNDLGYTIEQIPINDRLTPKAPDIKRPINFDKNLSPDVKIIIQKKIDESIKNIETEPLRYDLWLALGSNLKLAGDYEKVRDVWTYAYALEPNYSVTLINLGDLYGYYLKDKGLAEVNFLKAISVAPNDPYPYQRTAEFYVEVINDLDKAKNIIQDGLKLIGENPALREYLLNIESRMKDEKTESSIPRPL